MFLLQRRFTCRSAEYNYVTLQCQLSEEDRRTAPDSAFVDATGVDYFENLCLQGNQTCKMKRNFVDAKVGVPADRVAHYVGLHYYVDKELQASGLAGCKRACEIEEEFLCRSFLFKPSVTSGYNCQLYHMDHRTLPDGPATYLNTERPLLDNGSPLGQYQENVCEEKRDLGAMMDAAFGSGGANTVKDSDTGGLGNGGNGAFDVNAVTDGQDCDHTGTCYDGELLLRLQS